MVAAYYARAMSHGMLLGVEMWFPGLVHEKMTRARIKSCRGIGQLERGEVVGCTGRTQTNSLRRT